MEVKQESVDVRGVKDTRMKESVFVRDEYGERGKWRE